MDACLCECQAVRAIYHQRLKCIGLYNGTNTLIRHLYFELKSELASATLSPCSRFLALLSPNCVSIIDFQTKKSRIVEVSSKLVFWSRLGVMLLGVLDPLNDRVWMYHGTNLVLEVSVHGQILATRAGLIDDVYLVLEGIQQKQVFRLSTLPNIELIVERYQKLADLEGDDMSFGHLNDRKNELSQSLQGLNLLNDAPHTLTAINDFFMSNLNKMKSFIDELSPILCKMIQFEEMAKYASTLLNQFHQVYEGALLISEWLACWDHSKFVTRGLLLQEAFELLSEAKAFECDLVLKARDYILRCSNFSAFLTTSLK